MNRRTEAGALSRWSRRKTKARAGRPETDPVPEPARERRAATSPEPEETPLDPEAEAELLRKLDLPDPETLKTGDDFKSFLRKEVPERIRRRALARLWRSHPLLATVDDLVEYGEDFTDSALVVDNLKTIYQVGRGMVLPDEEETAAAKEAPAGDLPEQGTAAVEEQQEEPAMVEPEQALPSEEQEVAVVGEATPAPGTEADSYEPPRRRAMAFRFEGDET